MKKLTIRKKQCIGRVKLFGAKTELAPLTAKETALFGSIATVDAALEVFGATQTAGTLGYREGAAERLAAADEVYSAIRDIAGIAKSIREEGLDVGAAEAFRLPRSNNYTVLGNTAQAFVEIVEPRKALFIERGLAATFVEDLEALMATLGTATSTRELGLSKQVGGTAGADALADEGMKLVRQLRPIMRVRLRTQPDLLAQWNAAARVHRGATEAPEETPPLATPPGEGGGTSAAFTTAGTGGILA